MRNQDKIAEFTLSSKLKQIADTSDRVVGSPFQRRLKNGKVITVTGSARKAIRKERLRLAAAKTAYGDITLEKVDWKPGGIEKGKYKFTPYDDPLSKKLNRWKGGNVIIDRKTAHLKLDPNTGLITIRRHTETPVVRRKINLELNLDNVFGRARLINNGSARHSYRHMGVNLKIKQTKRKHDLNY